MVVFLFGFWFGGGGFVSWFWWFYCFGAWVFFVGLVFLFWFVFFTKEEIVNFTTPCAEK